MCWFAQLLKKDAKPELQAARASWALGQGHLVQASCKVDETYPFARYQAAWFWFSNTDPQEMMLYQYSCS